MAMVQVTDESFEQSVQEGVVRRRLWEQEPAAPLTARAGGA